MILCFSGTGNSRLVAERLAMLMEHKVTMLCGDVLAHSAGIELPVEDVIWVMPVYSWGVPPVVVKWIESLPEGWGTDVCHHIVLTCGDDTGNAHIMWRNILKHRGMKAGACFSVIMPNTYVFMKGFDVDSPDLRDAKLQRMPERVDEIAGKINNGFSGDDVMRGRWAWLKTSVVYPWFRKYAMNPRKFNVSHDCVSCGKCASVCPCGNIKLVDRIPVWGDRCALCAACYHICPRHAVDYGFSARFKGQYNINI